MALDDLSLVELSPYKFAAHIGKLEALAAGGDVYPVTVELDLVDYCNHSCDWCVDRYHGKHALDTEFALALLGELRSLGVEGIVLKGGGEPTLHGSFSRILRDAREIGFEVGLVTNGSRLLDTAEEVVRSAGYVRVSVDGPAPALHTAIHGADDFEKIIEGVGALLSLRRAAGQRHPIVGLSFAMDHSMLPAVGAAIRLGDQLGVDYVLLRPPFFDEVGRRNTMTTDEKKELLSAFERENASYDGPVRVMIDYWISDAEAKELDSRGGSPRRGRLPGRGVNGIEHITGMCVASPLLAVVSAGRKVFPCCNLRGIDEWCVGTIDYESGDSFEQVWHGEKRREVMSRIHRAECIGVCTHPMSRYNEVIQYLRGPRHHKGFL